MSALGSHHRPGGCAGWSRRSRRSAASRQAFSEVELPLAVKRHGLAEPRGSPTGQLWSFTLEIGATKQTFVTCGKLNADQGRAQPQHRECTI